MKKITGRFNINLFIVIGVLITSVYFLKPSYERLYTEAYGCIDYELNQINGGTDFNQNIETAFDECSAEIYRLTKSIYQEIIQDGKSNYIKTNMDYYFYKIFGMDKIVENTMKQAIQDEFRQKISDFYK
jgi:hypothetical protein